MTRAIDTRYLPNSLRTEYVPVRIPPVATNAVRRYVTPDGPALPAGIGLKRTIDIALARVPQGVSGVEAQGFAQRYAASVRLARFERARAQGDKGDTRSYRERQRAGRERRPVRSQQG